MTDGPLPSSALSSPAAALAYQAAQERMITLAFEQATRRFLREVRTVATDTLGAASIHELWSVIAHRQLDSLGLDPYVTEYLDVVLVGQSRLPDAVWEAVTTVVHEGVRQGLSTRQIEHDLDVALDVNTGDTALVERATPSLTAAGFWAGLVPTGSRWISRVRRDVRTGATGLYGSLAVRGLRIAGYAQKRWVTRHDDLVRETHAEADGQTVPLEAPFLVGGIALAHPGDRAAPYAETANCRCVIVGVLTGRP